MLKNNYLLAKIGVDTAENEPLKSGDVDAEKALASASPRVGGTASNAGTRGYTDNTASPARNFFFSDRQGGWCLRNGKL